MYHPLVSIISVNYNQTDVTLDMIRSVRRNSYTNVEIIVVDNGSKVTAEAAIQAAFSEVKVIVSPKNLGFAGGNNLAIATAKGEYLFFINNDTELTDGCIEQLLSSFQAQPNIGIISPLICYFPDHNKGKEIIQYAGFTAVSPITGRNNTIGAMEVQQQQYQKEGSTAYVHGAAMMLPREVIDKVGMMPHDFFLYYEELDWSEQIRRAGYEVWFNPKAKIYHKESLTVSKMGALKTYFITRNRIRFVNRNFGAVHKCLFYGFLGAMTIPKNVISFILKRDWANLRAFLLAIWWNIHPNTNNEFEQLTLQ